MADIKPKQVRTSALSELEHRLWKNFEEAEATYMPPVFNPWKVMRTFWRLWRSGKLRIYEFYPLYALVALAFGTLGTLGQRWLLVLYLVALVPMFVVLSKYVKQFAFDKTNVLGLDRYGFGVAHLPLLVHGMTELRRQRERFSVQTPHEASPFTKGNLASVIKLVKIGHEHGEVSYGVEERLKKLFFGGAALLATYFWSSADEARRLTSLIVTRVTQDPSAAAGAVFLISGLLYFVYMLLVSPAKEKRRKRRYLLALNTIHECWEEDEGVAAAPVVAAAPPANPAAVASSTAEPEVYTLPATGLRSQWFWAKWPGWAKVQLVLRTKFRSRWNVGR